MPLNDNQDKTILATYFLSLHFWHRIFCDKNFPILLGGYETATVVRYPTSPFADVVKQQLTEEQNSPGLSCQFYFTKTVGFAEYILNFLIFSF